MVDSFADEGTIDLSAQVPQTIGPYRIIREIGRGMMGTVYQAEHESLKRIVAVKVLPANLALLPARVERFRREMEAIGRLDHPNIVRATDAGEVDGVLFLAMELVEGQDVEQILSQAGSLNVPTACEIARQCANGLQNIASNGLVHRDLKPSNLLLSNDGTVKILDLGIAMLRHSEQDSGVTQADALMGTPDFMAPEQITECRNVDIRADIYSLGCTLYAMVAGQVPFPDGGSHVEKLLAHTAETARPVEELSSDVPKPLAAIIRKMMEKSPDDRFQSPEEVADALAEFADASTLCEISNGKSWQGKPNRLSTKPRKKKANVSWVPIAVVTGIAALIGLGALLVSEANRREEAQQALALEARAASEGNQQRLIGSTQRLAGSTKQIADTSQAIKDDTERLANSVDSLAESSEATSKQLVRSNESIEQSNGAIEKNTGKISESIEALVSTSKANSEQLANSTKSIDQNTQRIAQSLDALRKSFEAAQADANPLDNPKSAGDFYHNARVYEQKGNYRAARMSYLELFRFELSVVDPHHRFQQFLKLQEGLAGAREIYASVPGDKSTVVRRYADALLQIPTVRRERLNELSDEEPNFAPAVFELSREYSEARLGKQSLSDKRNEKKLLDRFIALHDQGHLLRYYLDQSEAAGLLEDAEQRMAALNSNGSLDESPVHFTFQYTAPRWMATFGLREPAVEIWYRESPNAEFKSTGPMTSLDPRTGKAMPQMWATMATRESCTVEVKYTDANGETQGPFSYDFDPAVEEVRWARNMIKTIGEQSWVQFGSGDNRDNLYFTMLQPFRVALKEVHYALDQDKPNVVHRFSDDPNDVSSMYRPVPGSTKFVVVKLYYSDGTESDVVRISR